MHRFASLCLHLHAAAAAAVFRDDDLPVDALLELRDMGDDAHEPAAARHAHKRGQRLLQRLTVERAETLVDEHCLKLYAAGARLHLVRQAERQ